MISEEATVLLMSANRRWSVSWTICLVMWSLIIEELVFLPVWAGSGSSGSLVARQKKKARVVWLPNKSSDHIDPNCLWFQKSPSACYAALLGVPLCNGGGWGWEPWPLPGHLQQPDESQLFNECLQFMSRLPGPIHLLHPGGTARPERNLLRG